MVVLLLGGLAAFAVTQLPTTPTLGTAPDTSTSGTATTTTGRSVVGGALVVECVSDYDALAAALGAYEALHGTTPPAGTQWATSTAGGPLVRTWPRGDGEFSIRWNGTALVVEPVHGAASVGSSGTTSPATGCQAL